MRSIFAIAAGLSAGCSLLGFAPSPEQAADITNTATASEHCKEVGRDAGHYAQYDECMKEAGLH